MAQIFISHSGKDAEAARRVMAWLSEQGFDQTFLDIDKDSGIQPGVQWEQTLYREIELSQAVILIVTKHWLDSKWCFAEFTQARALGKAIFPIIESPSGEQLVASDIQSIDLRSNREDGLDQLSRRLTEVALQSPEGFVLPQGEPPFPGLSAFEEKHAAIYFGRDDVVVRLIEALRKRRVHGGERLIALLGASGSGKSSLLRAGLLPRLKRDRQNWIVLSPIRPQFEPDMALIDALLVHVESPERAASWEEALTGSSPGPALTSVARYLRRKEQALEAQILVSIDQMEELFSAPSSSRDRFFSLLNAMLSANRPFLAVASLRSDHLADLQSAPAREVPFHAFPLEPLPTERLSMIIRGPANIAGLRVDDDLIAAIIHDATTADALPLVAFTLRELYERHGRSGHLTRADYESLGDRESGLSPLAHAVRLAAEEALPSSQRSRNDDQALRNAFVPHLVRVNTEGRFARRPARLGDLPTQARPLIEKLIDARLLVRRGGGPHQPEDVFVEVAHEALFRAWPDLAEWLEEERDFLVGKERLEDALRDWRALAAEEQQRGLLSGVLLDRAQAWLADYPARLTDEEQGYIRASAEHEAAQLANLRRSKSRFLADLSRQRLNEGHLGAALALAQRAVPLDVPDWPRVRTAENALSLALHTYDTAAVRPVVGYTGHDGTVQGALLSDDDKTVLTWSYDGTARLWDTDTGEPLAVLAHEAGVRGASFSPDQRRVLTWSFDGTAAVWKVATGERLCRLAHEDVVQGAVFSGNGARQVLTWSFDGTAGIWDAATGVRQVTLQHERAVCGASFFRDDARVVTWAHDETAAVWDAAGGELLSRLRHDDGIRGTQLLDQERRLLTWSYDKKVRLWDAENGNEVWRINCEKRVQGALLLSHDEYVLIWATEAAQIFSVEDGKERVRHEHEHVVMGAVASAEEDRLLTWSADFVAHVWDARTGEQIREIKHHDMILGARFSPDGSHALTWSYDGVVQLSALEDAEEAADDEQKQRRQDRVWRHGAAIRGAAFSENGQWVWTRSDDGTVRLWKTDQAEASAELTHRAEVLSVRFAGASQRLLTASADGTARLWEYGPSSPFARLGDDSQLAGAAFSTDGEKILTWGEEEPARLWEARSGECLQTFPVKEPIATGLLARNGAFAVTCASGTVHLWSTDTGIRLGVLQPMGNTPSLLLSPADDRLLMWSDTATTATLWDLEAPDETHDLAHAATVRGGEFSADNRLALTRTGNGTVHLWCASTGEEIQRLYHEGIVGAALSPNARRIVTWADHPDAHLWDSESGEVVARLPHAADVLGTAFAPGGRRIVTWADQETAFLWAADTGDLLRSLQHGERVKGCAFLDDDTLLTWAVDGVIRKWRMEAESPFLLMIPEGGASTATLSGDQRTLFVSDSIWDVATGDLLARKDWNQYLAISPDCRFALNARGQLWQIHVSAEQAARRALAISEYLRPLSRQERRRAYLHDDEGREGGNIVSERHAAMSGNRVHTESRTRTPADVVEMSTGARIAAGMRVDIKVSDVGELFVFHAEPLGPSLKHVEVNRLNRNLYFVLESGHSRNFGIPINQRLMRYVERADRVLMVHMAAETGKPLSGGYYPLYVY